MNSLEGELYSSLIKAVDRVDRKEDSRKWRFGKGEKLNSLLIDEKLVVKVVTLIGRW